MRMSRATFRPPKLFTHQKMRLGFDEIARARRSVIASISNHRQRHCTKLCVRRPGRDPINCKLVVPRVHRIRDPVIHAMARTPAMREGIDIEVSAADRERLAAVVVVIAEPAKHVWRARIILATGESCGTAGATRRAGSQSLARGAAGSGSCAKAWPACCTTRRAKPVCHHRRPPVSAGRPCPRADSAPSRLERQPMGPAAPWPAMPVGASSLSSMQRIWAAHKLQPHRLRTFQAYASTPPLPLNWGPGHRRALYRLAGSCRLVLSIDQKSQIQALDRTQPGLPLEVGPGRDHDPRSTSATGTTTLFAAFNVLRRDGHWTMHGTSTSPSGIHPLPEC